MNAKNRTSQSFEFALKPLSREGITAAQEKAEQYRLLNQPRLAESICLDILAVDPGNQKAIVAMILALTDQFGHSASKASKQAFDLIGKLKDEYARRYYTGIINERLASAALNSGTPGADFDACEWYLDAMDCYEEADRIRPAGTDDPILRWNTCARIIMQYNLKPRPVDDSQPILE